MTISPVDCCETVRLLWHHPAVYTKLPLGPELRSHRAGRYLRRQSCRTAHASWQCSLQAALSFTFMQISEATELEDSTRQLATEFLVTLCEAREKAPGMMRKLPQQLARLFQCLVFFLLDIEVGPCSARVSKMVVYLHCMYPLPACDNC